MTLALVPVLILFFNQLSLGSLLENDLAIPMVSMGVVPHYWETADQPDASVL